MLAGPHFTTTSLVSGLLDHLMVQTYQLAVVILPYTWISAPLQEGLSAESVGKHMAERFGILQMKGCEGLFDGQY